ncbi:MAG: hypothetical protein SFV51_01400, partial [Bryobacteraceae bacterium]|nr:hypothetical protein [Bryobacteraceae bacterium]
MTTLAIALAAMALGAAVPDGPFRHRPHAPLRLKCSYCHATAEKEEAASFPALAQCRTCHPSIAERTSPSRRVVSVPAFVFFSHSVHLF